MKITIALFGLGISATSAFTPPAVVATTTTNNHVGMSTITLASTTEPAVFEAAMDAAVAAVQESRSSASSSAVENGYMGLAQAAPAPVDIEGYYGEKSNFRANTYVDPANEVLAFEKKRIPQPIHFAERQLQPTSLTDIRAQQRQHGLHTTSNFDSTRNCMRN